MINMHGWDKSDPKETYMYLISGVFSVLLMSESQFQLTYIVLKTNTRSRNYMYFAIYMSFDTSREILTLHSYFLREKKKNKF